MAKHIDNVHVALSGTLHFPTMLQSGVEARSYFPSGIRKGKAAGKDLSVYSVYI